MESMYKLTDNQVELLNKFLQDAGFIEKIAEIRNLPAYFIRDYIQKRIVLKRYSESTRENLNVYRDIWIKYKNEKTNY